MDATTQNIGEEYKWYRDVKFPLVPRLRVLPPGRPPSEYDDGRIGYFWFRWLIFTAYSFEVPSFEVAVVCDTNNGIGFHGVLLYVRWFVCVPCPRRLGMRINNALRRRC